MRDVGLHVCLHIFILESMVSRWSDIDFQGIFTRFTKITRLVFFKKKVGNG